MSTVSKTLAWWTHASFPSGQSKLICSRRICTKFPVKVLPWNCKSQSDSIRNTAHSTVCQWKNLGYYTYGTDRVSRCSDLDNGLKESIVGVLSPKEIKEHTYWSQHGRKFGESHDSESYLCNCSSLFGFGLFCLLLFGVNTAETESESPGESHGKVKEEQERRSGLWTWSTLELWRSFFSVNAAKPFDNDNANTESPSYIKGGSGGISKRQHFNFIADVLEAVKGAVVCIEVKDHSTVNWFGVPQTASNGSGFIVKENGLILTNAHVVATQQQCSISVKLPDGRCFAGQIEDVDYESDLATVRIQARGLQTLPLGCSAKTRIGEWVVAVGSPLNLSNSVTAGIVSSTSRGANELGISVNDINYIQTDAAITFGNSGGPLINLDGEAIGINSMKVTPGISFAIPIDHAKNFLKIAEARRAAGRAKLTRRYMGLAILTLTDQIRTELQMRTGVCVVERGVFVWQIVTGGPAFLAGLLPGDVITKINGNQMRTAGQVHEIIKTYDKLIVEVQRRGNMQTFTIYPENVA